MSQYDQGSEQQPPAGAPARPRSKAMTPPPPTGISSRPGFQGFAIFLSFTIPFYGLIAGTIIAYLSPNPHKQRFGLLMMVVGFLTTLFAVVIAVAILYLQFTSGRR